MLLHLRKHIEAHETGSLSTVDAFGIPIVIYLLQGTVVAAHAGDDTHALLRILLKREWLRDEEVHRLREQTETLSIYDALVADGENMHLREAFYDRFRENLCRALSSTGGVQFQEMDAVMIPNIQLCHDTTALLTEACSLVERTKRLRTADKVHVVERGSRPPLSRPEKRLLDQLTEACPLQSIVRQSPFESFQTWDLLSDMLERNVLSLVEEEKTTPPPREKTIPSREPRLSKNEAQAKIDVLNHVVHAFHQASDKSAGPGAGRAQIRLLLDGSPAQFAMLFNGLPIGSQGILDSEELVERLRSRLGPERRRLLNAGLRDLIQRTLSMADESLPEPQMNQLLEDISGHDSRLGW